MASWDPESYVAEALSRHIASFARENTLCNVPSYYEAVTNSLQVHEESKHTAAVLEEQATQNVGIDVDLWGKLLNVVVNPRDMRDVANVKKKVECLVKDAAKVTENISLELSSLNGKGGNVKISEYLFGILNHVRDMSIWSNNLFDPTLEKRCASTTVVKQELDTIHQMSFSDGFIVHWPSEMFLYLDDYMKAWLVDHVIHGIKEMKSILGALVTYEKFASASGHSRQSEIWKSGIKGFNYDDDKRYIACFELCDEKPAIATQVVPQYLFDAFGMQCATLNCRTACTAYCLSRILSESVSDEAALRFVHDWRTKHSSDSNESILAFLLTYGDGKTISDLADKTVGENDALRLHIHDNKAQISQVYQKIEKELSYEECVLKALRRTNCSDGFYLISSERNMNLEKRIKNCFSTLPTPCVVASYADCREQVCVSIVKCVEVSETDGKCTLVLSQTSPLYNYVYSVDSQITLNFFHSNGKIIYEKIQNEYPSWINESENKLMYFEYQGKRCVTTTVLKEKCTTSIFITLESHLIGDQLFAVGRFLGEYPRQVLLKKGESFSITNSFLYEQINPFFFTTVHRLCGTVGLVGHGCHLCTLHPPVVIICCPMESSSFVLDEKNAGPVCSITFPSKEGGGIFSKKNYEELRSAIPVPASSVMTLPQEKVAFRIKGRILESFKAHLGNDIMCTIVVNDITEVTGDPLMLNVSSNNEIVDVK